MPIKLKSASFFFDVNGRNINVHFEPSGRKDSFKTTARIYLAPDNLAWDIKQQPTKSAALRLLTQAIREQKTKKETV